MFPVTFVLHLAILLERNRLWLLPGFVILLFLVPGAPGRRKLALRTLIVALGLGNFLGGPLLSGWLLYRVGETATAQVVSTYQTSTQINDHDVVGYNVLIRDGRGDTVASRFEDDEFNIFPPSDFSYPRVGESFGVRILPGYPRDFIMLTDDSSPWTRRYHCDALSLRLSDAEQRFEFARGAVPFRAPYAEAIDAYLAQGCAGDELGSASFRQDRTRALAGEAGMTK